MSKVLDRPVVLPAVNVDAPDRAYTALARKIGITVPALPPGLMLRDALHRLSLPVYNYRAVLAYLISKRPDKHFVIWQALTSRQNVVRQMSEMFPRWSDEWTAVRRSHGSIRVAGSYNKPVPYPVLLTIDSILKEGKSAGFTPIFFVSDFAKPTEKPKPLLRIDPFLAVGAIDSGDLFVIERWDEPGFREETYLSRQKKTPLIKTKSVR